MTDDPTAPPPPTPAARTEDAPLDDSGDPELEQDLAGEDLEGEDDEPDEDDDGTDPLAGPVPEPPPPHDEKEPDPVPATLWESDADHLDPTAPVPRDHVPDIDPDKLDPDALKVVNRLLQYGHQAYLVGGCVRDLLAGRTPKDFDVATSALPSEVRGIFRNCRLIGRRFRLAHVYFKGGKIVEVSTFRANPSELEDPAEPGSEGEEKDDLLISDDNVFGTAEQDARRRDFTINGLFYDVADGRVIDFVGGLRDMRLRDVRTIGDPEIRMREDPVRILRAVRFACRLDFDIESRTYAAMEGAVEDIPRCAPPRLLEDTFRILRGGVSAGGLNLLFALDALKFLLPPVDAWLKERGAEGAALLRAHAERLDARVRSGGVLEDSVLLATLLLPLLRSSPAPAARPEAAPAPEGPDAPLPAEAEETAPSVPPAVEDLLQELVRTARLPRRIAERCRMILLAQATLSGQRRRRGGLASFRRHPLFQEALTVFELSVEATGEHRAALDAWRSGSVPTPPTGSPPSEGGRRRRRRRRRGPRSGSPPAAGN
ncbi:MAG TPA: polynucleotide adenylyltransferase PcnB [Myxococcaceae bacterium]|nr:polynucleotide adenylyltransferase PcnB [Myxococcaceae bacterium]